MQLNLLQKKFQQYLLQSSQHIFHGIADNLLLKSADGLKIYHRAYQAKLERALSDNYPALTIFLGKQKFAQLCQDYIYAYPSLHYSIRYFGDQLSCFLEEKKFLSEFAAFEWTMSLMFDAANEKKIHFSDIACLPASAWSDMRLQFQPSVYRLNLCWNTVKIWENILKEKKEISPPCLQTSMSWLLWRQGMTSRYCILSPAEAWAVDAVLGGCSFSEICQGLCQYVAEENAGPLAGVFLRNWLQAELIANLILEDGNSVILKTAYPSRKATAKYLKM
jgi:hypothetical protein